MAVLGALAVAIAAAALGLTGFRLSTSVIAATATGSSYTALSPIRILDTRKSASSLGAGQSLTLAVTGLNGVPADATAVALNVTVTDTTAASFLTVYPSGEATPQVSNLNWVAGQTVANLVVVSVGAEGEVTVYNDSGSADVIADLQGYFATAESDGAGDFVPLSPARIADTRPNSGEPLAGDTLAPAQSLDIQVASAGGVPVSGVAAVVVNVTVTDTTASSYLAVYPQGQANPGTSSLNWTGGRTVANRVMVPLGPSGQITVYNDAGSADVVVDVDGYFTSAATSIAPASLFFALAPTRVLDTRVDGGTLGPTATISERFAGLDGIAAGATALVANLTVTETTAASFFTLSPDPGAPQTSDLNWAAGETVANLAVPRLDSSGNASVYNDQGSAQAILDVFGYFLPVTSSSTVSSSPACTGASVMAPTDGTLGGALAVSVRSTCPVGVTAYYSYWYQAPNTSIWTLAQGSVTTADYSYDTAGWIAGAYQILVWVTSQSGVYEQTYGSAGTLMAPPPCTGVSISASPSPGLVSMPLVLTATPQCPSGITPYYQFSYLPFGNSGSPIELTSGWTSQPSLVVSTIGWDSGTYDLYASVSSSDTGSDPAQSVTQDTLQSSGSIVDYNVPYSPQAYGMDCEEAALEMALAHEDILLQGNNVNSQDDILGAEGVDKSVPGIGPNYTSGDPMQNFIGPPNGTEASGYEPGAYYGAVVKAALHFGASVVAAGEQISPAQVFAYVEQGDPVQTWVTFNFQHYNPIYLSNGRDTWPWVGPHEHSVVVVGVGVNEVLIDNPWSSNNYGAAYVGQDQWVPLSVFEGAYSSFNDMAVVLG